MLLECEEIIRKEELLWFQWARAKWIKYRDRNSKYFHGVIAIRRQENFIEFLQGGDGHWVIESEDMERLVTNYLSSIFIDSSIVDPFFLKIYFPKMVESEVEIFQAQVTNDEILQALFSIGNFKAPKADVSKKFYIRANGKWLGSPSIT